MKLSSIVTLNAIREDCENRQGSNDQAFNRWVAETIRKVIVNDGLENAAPPGTCKIPPKNWYCSRESGHEGPCAAYPFKE